MDEEEAGPELPAERSWQMKLAGEYFRAGVGAVIADAAGRVLVLERADVPGAWQLPQGGLEGGEEPLPAVWREVQEETGLSGGDLELVARCPDPLAYELPVEARSDKTGRGQVQYWFLFRFLGEEKRIRLSPHGEFGAFQWASFGQLLAEVVPFRRPVYERLAEHFSLRQST
jgi:putative (di)nucleoside polyphosphate hydrolase